MDTCTYVFKKGVKKDTPCGKKCDGLYCKVHSLCEVNKNQFPITDLPQDCLRDIIQLVAKHVMRSNMNAPNNAVKTLMSLSCCNKQFYEMIDNSIWDEAWKAYCTKTKTKIKVNTHLSSKDKLMLYTFTGCQFCKTPRIRKIYEEFQIRCCKECLYARTISSYQLKKEYDIDENKLKNLPYISKDMYTYRVGYYTLYFYQIQDVERKLGKTLQQIAQEKKRKKIKSNIEEVENYLKTLPFDYNYLCQHTNFDKDNLKEPECVQACVYITRAKNIYVKAKIDEWLETKDTIEYTDVLKKSFTLKKLYSSSINTKFDLLDKHWPAIIKDCKIIRFEQNFFVKATENNFTTYQITKVKNTIKYKDILNIALWNDEVWNQLQELLNKTTNNNSAQYTANQIKHIKCSICKNERLFSQQGLEQHCRDKHNM